MSKIDEELESFSSDDIDGIIQVLMDASDDYERKRSIFSETSFEDFKKKGYAEKLMDDNPRLRILVSAAPKEDFVEKLFEIFIEREEKVLNIACNHLNGLLVKLNLLKSRL